MPSPSVAVAAASAPVGAVPFFLHPAFWAVISIAASFFLAYLLLHRPRKWWLLVAAAIASFVLFGPFGSGGFLAALGLKLWQNKDGPVPVVLATESPKKPESAQAVARQKRRQKPE